MNYWVAMEERELKASMVLLEAMVLPGVLWVSEEDSFDKALTERMKQKRFFQKNEKNELEWNPFVRYILQCVLESDTYLRQEREDGSLCVLYFQEEIMVLLVKRKEEDLYRFYYVPFLPQAIGGIAGFHEDLEAVMIHDASEEEDATNIQDLTEENEDDHLSPDTDIRDASAIIQAAEASERFRTEDEDEFSIRIEGFVNHEQTYTAAVVREDERYLYLMKDEDLIRYKYVDYFNMTGILSRWIVRTHAGCISGKRSVA